MVLAPVTHKLFDGFELWLTPVQVDLVLSLYHRLTAINQLQDPGNVVSDMYNTGFARDIWSEDFKHSVTFRTHLLPNGRSIEPPSPQFLALHAACAQVAHMSGAAGLLEESFRYTESIPLMTAAPNSADELVHALKKVQLQRLTRPMHV